MNNNIIKIEASEEVKNSYMAYGMNTICDRALPKIEDGLLPVYKKIIYSMNNAKMLSDRDHAKCLDIIGNCTKIYVHGDASLMGAISILEETNETQLHPFLEGQGNFGNVRTKGKYSAPRYVFARLKDYSKTMFTDLNKNVVDFIGGEHKEPLTLNPIHPNILTMTTSAVAVGEACSFYAFPLKDICNYTSLYIKDKTLNPADYITPDFNTGYEILYDKKAIESILNTGSGSIRVRAKYTYDKENRIIIVNDIPQSTTIESILESIKDILKNNPMLLKEITDVRDATCYDEKTKTTSYEIEIDVKNGTNIESLMSRLYKSTPLEKAVSYNMNCLWEYTPMVLGVNAILDRWLSFRISTLKKSIQYDLNIIENKLYYLTGIRKVLSDSEKAIEIIRFSKKDEIISKLMNYFNIDEQIAIKSKQMPLENINEERVFEINKEIEELTEKKNDLNYKLNNKSELENIIISQLKEVSDKYSKERHCKLVEKWNELSKEELIEDYNCNISLSREGYIKKYKQQTDNNKVKDGDKIIQEFKCNNKDTLFLFTNKANRIKLSVNDLDLVTASKSLGSYLPTLLSNIIKDKDEKVIKVISIPQNPKGYILNIYENGNISKVDIDKYISNYQVLVNCYNLESPIIDVQYIDKDVDILLISSDSKGLIFNTSELRATKSKNTQGVTGIKLNDGANLIYSNINPPKNLLLSTILENNKESDLLLNDIAPTGKPNEERSCYDYIYGRRNRKGNLLFKKNIISIREIN